MSKLVNNLKILRDFVLLITMMSDRRMLESIYDEILSEISKIYDVAVKLKRFDVYIEKAIQKFLEKRIIKYSRVNIFNIIRCDEFKELFVKIIEFCKISSEGISYSKMWEKIVSMVNNCEPSVCNYIDSSYLRNVVTAFLLSIVYILFTKYLSAKLSSKQKLKLIEEFFEPLTSIDKDIIEEFLKSVIIVNKTRFLNVILNSERIVGPNSEDKILLRDIKDKLELEVRLDSHLLLRISFNKQKLREINGIIIREERICFVRAMLWDHKVSTCRIKPLDLFLFKKEKSNIYNFIIEIPVAEINFESEYPIEIVGDSFSEGNVIPLVDNKRQCIYLYIVQGRIKCISLKIKNNVDDIVSPIDIPLEDLFLFKGQFYRELEKIEERDLTLRIVTGDMVRVEEYDQYDNFEKTYNTYLNKIGEYIKNDIEIIKKIVLFLYRLDILEEDDKVTVEIVSDSLLKVRRFYRNRFKLKLSNGDISRVIIYKIRINSERDLRNVNIEEEIWKQLAYYPTLPKFIRRTSKTEGYFDLEDFSEDRDVIIVKLIPCPKDVLIELIHKTIERSMKINMIKHPNFKNLLYAVFSE